LGRISPRLPRLARDTPGAGARFRCGPRRWPGRRRTLAAGLGAPRAATCGLGRRLLARGARCALRTAALGRLRRAPVLASRGGEARFEDSDPCLELRVLVSQLVQLVVEAMLGAAISAELAKGLAQPAPD